jgi:hypothetical protein
MVFWLFMTVFLQLFSFFSPQHAVQVCSDILDVHTFSILQVPESSSGESYIHCQASNSVTEIHEDGSPIKIVEWGTGLISSQI